jgi:hypothetical protein
LTRFVGKLQPILSALPKGIAETAFKRPKEERIRQRAELVSRIEGEIAERSASASIWTRSPRPIWRSRSGPCRSTGWKSWTLS